MNLRQHVVLLGMMGSGKSTLAPMLARQFGAASRETDADIVALAGMGIADIFEHEGEDRFRELETQALRAALADPPSVIAAGGGLPAFERNRSLLAQAGSFCVHLAVDPDVLAERIGADVSRPLLAGDASQERIAALLAERAQAYRSVADFAVQVGREEHPAATIRRIAEAISDAVCAS